MNNLKKIALHTRLYVDGNPQRDAEIRTCLKLNVAAGFDTIFFYCPVDYKADALNELIEELKPYYPIGKDIWLIAKHDEIPTFNQIIDKANIMTPDHINVIANTDIAFPSKAVADLQSLLSNREDLAVALSRWDNAEPEPVLFDRADSQDVWAWTGRCKGKTSIDFTLGKAGCDNRFAWELQQMGYLVVNMGKSIKTIHYHASNIRHYNSDSPVPPPYLTIQPQ